MEIPSMILMDTGPFVALFDPEDAGADIATSRLISWGSSPSIVLTNQLSRDHPG